MPKGHLFLGIEVIPGHLLTQEQRNYYAPYSGPGQTWLDWLRTEVANLERCLDDGDELLEVRRRELLTAETNLKEFLR